jgi:glucose-6-phosphate isomerase
MKTKMNTRDLLLPSLFFGGGCPTGEGVTKGCRTLSELSGIFEDEAARAAMPGGTLVYEVYSHMPEGEGTPGGLFFGLTRLFAGRVGQEHFMTRVHFRRPPARTEYYWCPWEKVRIAGATLGATGQRLAGLDYYLHL